LRIGINALYMIPGQVGGTEIYLRSLLDAMTRVSPQHQYLAFINKETEVQPLSAAPSLQLIPLGVRATNRPARIFAEQTTLPHAAHNYGCDVLFNPGFTSPRSITCPTVTVFHDLQHKRHPEHFRWWDLPFWNLLLGQSAHASTKLISVSQATRADLQHFYHRDSTVIHHGVDPQLFTLDRKPENLLLCVSTLHPHKNLVRLARVFAQFHARHPEWQLVIAGMRGHHVAQVEASAGALLGNAITIPGWIPREDLYTLYARARAFIYPSTFEGFGMPVAEALAAALPTACSDIPVLREVGGDAALYFEPTSDAAMLAALERLPTHPANPGHARQFSWERCAQETLAVLRGAAHSARAPV
jgi:glycosyltransferase involved in cell wall biosynthesis